ncbi:MAG: ParB/RepB/Spo0J family partition protein [Flavobacteriales bacterium]|jgi:ParB family transcriptional regulator, chromosome partitioning protein|nr:ParB/RepB/Spo0J family partition protein [Flavobacteriales bacterium]
MTKKRGSLGRGLSAILGNTSIGTTAEAKQENTPVVGKTHEILLTEIETNPFQPRTEFNQKKLHELALSIEHLGIIQPITVRKLKENKYQLISGERRFRASKIAGLGKIAAFVRIANDQEMLEMALVENIQRESLNPIEIALSYQRLIEEVKLTQEQCSERVGKNRTTVTNFLRLLKLPFEIQKGLSDGKISTGHARALITVRNKVSQLNIFYDIVLNGYSVRDVEQLAKDFANSNYKRTSKNKAENSHQPLPFQHQKMMHDLSRNLEKEVKLKRNKKGKGKLIIPFNNDEDLAKIFEIINN